MSLAGTNLSTGPLCWGQHWSWREQQLPVAQRSPGLLFRERVALPAGVCAPLVRDALERVLARHDSLRSTFEPGGGDGPVQLVWPPAARRYEFDLIDDFTELAAWHDRDFDLAARWPIRAALVRPAGGSVRLVLMVHHIASDRFAANLLVNEVGQAVLGRMPPRRGVRQPLELAAYERSEAGRSISARAIAYWTRHNGEMSDLMRTFIAGTGQPGGHMLITDVISTAARRALASLAAASGQTEASVAIAAVACALATYLDRDRVLMTTLAANRHLRGVEWTVCSLAQSGLMMTRLDRPDSLRMSIATTSSSALTAYRHGYYDNDALSRALSGTERGGLQLPSVNVAPGLAGAVEPPTPEDPYSIATRTVDRPCHGANFHLYIYPSTLVIRVRVGANLLTAADARALVVRATDLILTA